MPEFPDRHFNTWTSDEVETACEGEPVDVMPGSGRRVPGPRRKLLEAMRDASVTIAGDLPGPQRDRFAFALVDWPKARARRDT
jgi:hypothetical protein